MAVQVEQVEFEGAILGAKSNCWCIDMGKEPVAFVKIILIYIISLIA